MPSRHGTRTARRTAPVAVGAALAVALLSGCGTGDDGEVAASAPAAPSSSSSPTTAPSAEPTPSPSETVTPSATPTASASAAPTPAWPKALGEPQQGDPVWGVYLAVGHSAGDADVEQAQKDAASVGYQAVVGDVACDQGAMEALGLDEYDYWSAATLYFANQKQANAFAAAYTAEVGAPKGVAKVNVGCLD